jgi:hypothetical protein
MIEIRHPMPEILILKRRSSSPADSAVPPGTALQLDGARDQACCSQSQATLISGVVRIRMVGGCHGPKLPDWWSAAANRPSRGRGGWSTTPALSAWSHKRIYVVNITVG